MFLVFKYQLFTVSMWCCVCISENLMISLTSMLPSLLSDKFDFNIVVVYFLWLFMLNVPRASSFV